MIRRLAARLTCIAGAAGLLAACDPLTSTQPLFEAGGVRPALGVWAAAGEDCALPTSSDMAKWPACVQPFLVDAYSVSFTRSPGRPEAGMRFQAPYALSDGDPMLVRIGGAVDAARPGPGYHFAAATDLRRNAEGRLIEARGVIVMCPGGEPPGVSNPAQGTCRAQTADAVRRVATSQLQDTAPIRLRWMAPPP